MKTLVSLVPNNERLPRVTAALQEAGISESGIRMLVRLAELWQQFEGRSKLGAVVRSAIIGGLIGLLAGALYGVPGGILNCSRMGCPFGTGGLMLVLITIYAVLGAAFLGTIIGLDRLEQNLYSYIEGVRRGSALLMVETPDDIVSDVTSILRREHGQLVKSIE